MKIEDLKVGDKVYDGWYAEEWGVGTVTKLFKTTVHIEFTERGMTIYDKAHVQYLETKEDYFKRIT